LQGRWKLVLRAARRGGSKDPDREVCLVKVLSSVGFGDGLGRGCVLRGVLQKRGLASEPETMTNSGRLSRWRFQKRLRKRFDIWLRVEGGGVSC